MSDGPHRSLPLRRHWKEFAKRCATAAFSPAEVCEALPHALLKDILEAPITKVRDIMESDILFSDMRIEQLERLRLSNRSAAGSHLIDAAITAIADDRKGQAGIEAALEAAFEGVGRAAFRSIEEHYMRKAGSRSAGFVRARMDAARQQHDLAALAREVLSAEKPPSRRSVSLPRHLGVDEGPPL